jgi:hypothetical protein
MYCHSCGNALSQKMKYCNRCGTMLIASDPPAEKKAQEKRVDNYLEGLFWVTMIGLAFIFGGLMLLKKAQFSDTILLVYLIVSSTAFLINFAINLWGAVRLMLAGKDVSSGGIQETAELESKKSETLLNPAPAVVSITENTTRSLEPVYNKQKVE